MKYNIWFWLDTEKWILIETEWDMTADNRTPLTQGPLPIFKTQEAAMAEVHYRANKSGCRLERYQVMPENEIPEGCSPIWVAVAASSLDL